MSDTDYIFLQAWNLMLGGKADYNLSRARKAHAPADAIFQRRDETWATIANCVNDAARDETIAIAAARFGWDAVNAALRTQRRG